MDSGMVPARGLVSFCVELVPTQARTCQGIAVQVQLSQVGEVADGLGDGACAWAREFLCRHWFNTKRTVEAHAPQAEFSELRERRDIIRDRAAELVAAEAELFESRSKRREQPQRLG